MVKKIRKMSKNKYANVSKARQNVIDFIGRVVTITKFRGEEWITSL